MRCQLVRVGRYEVPGCPDLVVTEEDLLALVDTFRAPLPVHAAPDSEEVVGELIALELQDGVLCGQFRVGERWAPELRVAPCWVASSALAGARPLMLAPFQTPLPPPPLVAAPDEATVADVEELFDFDAALGNP